MNGSSGDENRQVGKLIIALDVASKEEAARLVEALSDRVGLFKVGLGLFLSAGADAVRLVKDLGGEVFLDLKFHDIPSQVVRGCRAATGLGVKMLTVHASGGAVMMQEAAAAVTRASREFGLQRPAVLGVTVLTSLDQAALVDLGVQREVQEQVVYLARQAKESGLDGVVCSPQEISLVRQKVGDDFLIVTPGIRTSPEEGEDQKRTMDAGSALQAGADFLVIGRPVIEAEEPAAVVDDILRQIS